VAHAWNETLRVCLQQNSGMSEGVSTFRRGGGETEDGMIIELQQEVLFEDVGKEVAQRIS
jgi:hypothetical protein